MAPITETHPDFGLPAAYAASSAILAKRRARGERPVGWKIGFTNVTIWDEYGVHAPIWGPIYASTVAMLTDDDIECSLGRLVEPRIEPEIVVRFARHPEPDMDEAALLDCIDGVAHGFEIVQSLFPAWRFRAADTVAALALHGCLRHGPFVPLTTKDERVAWLQALASFSIALSRDGTQIDIGKGVNVLGGPLSALRAFVQGLAASHSFERGIEPGDVVTTGTITRAFPVRGGERWNTVVTGLPLRGLKIRFA